MQFPRPECSNACSNAFHFVGVRGCSLTSPRAFHLRESAALQQTIDNIAIGGVQVAIDLMMMMLKAFWPLWLALGVLVIAKMIFRFAAMEVGARRGWNLFWFWNDK